MRTTHKINLLVDALVSALALMNVRAADIIPAEAKAIAEEAFIYGLPIVMNYAVMYDYAVDKTTRSSRRRQSDQERSSGVYLRGHGHYYANSDTPYSFAWLDLRAEPVVLTVPEVEKGAITSSSWLTGPP